MADACNWLLLLLSCTSACSRCDRNETAAEISHIGEIKIGVGQRAKLQIGSLEVCFEETCLIEVRILKVTFSHVSFLQPGLVKVAVFSDNAEQVNALHRSADEVTFADVSRAKRRRAQVALAEVTLDQNCLVETDLGGLAVIHVTASHVRIIEAHVA